jgi:outer membrane protein, adhesin transport system
MSRVYLIQPAKTLDNTLGVCLPGNVRFRGRLRGVVAFVWAGMAACALTLGFSNFAHAQDGKPLTLKEAAQKAVLNNPEVLARWHTLRAADNERDVGAGALLPRVDFLAGAGTERRSEVTVRSPYDRTSTSLTITQVLYDGFATRNEIKRLDHARLVRLFEFFDTSESVALEVGRAYYDVLRYRQLVQLAEDNFVQHRSVFDQTDRRVRAKVARAVDLEQISARLALAEANLLTETSNLHDTTARFQRLVGQVPSADMPLPEQLKVNIPADATTAVRQAQQRNGALRASIRMCGLPMRRCLPVAAPTSRVLTCACVATKAGASVVFRGIQRSTWRKW